MKIKLYRFHSKKYLIDLTKWAVYDGNETLQKSDGILLSMFRNNKGVAIKSLRHLTKHSRLLALRDQECFDSKGYEFTYNKRNYFIYYNPSKDKWIFDYHITDNALQVYFKTKKDVKKICKILNNDRFWL